MKRHALLSLTFAIGLTALAIHRASPTAPASASTVVDKPMAHMVFFTLKDRTPEAREKLVAACEKYLSDHEGVRHFSVGTIAEDVEEPASVRDFDVALHLIFDDKHAGEVYQESDRHQQFVGEIRETVEKVRVFDTYLDVE